MKGNNFQNNQQQAYGIQQGSGYPGIGGYQNMPPNPSMNMGLSPQQQQMMQYQNNMNQWAPTQKVQRPMPPVPGMSMSQALSQAYNPQMPMSPYLMNPSPGSGKKKAARQAGNLPPIAPNMIPQQTGMPSGQQQWYPQMMSPNRGFPNSVNQMPMMPMGNMPGMNGYGMRPPSNAPGTRNKVQQGPNFYQQPQQFVNPNQGYPQMQQPAFPTQSSYRPPRMNQPPPVQPPMMSPQQQQLPMLASPQVPNNLYGGYPFQSGQDLNRSGSGHSIASSRPGSSTSTQERHIGKGGRPFHPSSFRTGMNASAKGGRRTPIEIRGTLTTQQRYAKGSQASLGASEFDSYSIHDWRQLKSRDGSMRLPAGLGHTETDEWRDKHRKMERMQQYANAVRQRSKAPAYQ